MPVLILGALLGMLVSSRVLSRRRRELLDFLAQSVHRRETFDEVVWGVPHGRLPEATSWVLLAGGLLLFGALGALWFGVMVLVMLRSAPQTVLPALVSGYAAWAGWRGLASQVGRVPVVRRLRLTQPHLVVDEVALGLHVTAEAVEAAPLARDARTIPWSDIAGVGVDGGGSVVITCRGGAQVDFGPLPDATAEEIVARIRHRRAAEGSSQGEVIDLDRARLEALTERAERPTSGNDGPG